MEFKEVRKNRIELSSKILEMIRLFERVNNVTVSDIVATKLDSASMNAGKIIRVDVEVKI